MHAKFSYAYFEWSFCAIYYYFFINQNISFVEQGALEKSGTFVQWGYTRHSIVCMLFLFRCFQCHALKRYRPYWQKSATFFLAPDFINSVISHYSGEYCQLWITTQNVRKKSMHALHIKWTIWIKYFSSYIKKCQTGTYFFGWVYLVSISPSPFFLKLTICMPFRIHVIYVYLGPKYYVS